MNYSMNNTPLNSVWLFNKKQEIPINLVLPLGYPKRPEHSVNVIVLGRLEQKQSKEHLPEKVLETVGWSFPFEL